MFLSGSHLCVRMGYTLPHSIKEEKKDEEGVFFLAFRIHKGEKAGKLKVKKKQERKFREFFFHFLSKALENYNRRVEFSSL